MHSPFRMHTEQTCIHESAGEEMDREHYDWINMCPPSLGHIPCFQKRFTPESLANLQLCERHDKLAGTARSSSDGTNAATAVTQRCQLFHSDSLQMPPGQEAKINTICSETGMQ